MTCHVLTRASGIHSIQKLGCVAQLDRALPSGGRGRGFESRRIQFAFQLTFRTCMAMFYVMRTDATTVAEYLQQIPQQWKTLVDATRERLLASIPSGYDESLRWGMISYEVPLEVSGPTYNHQPLMFAALAAQKNYCSLYLSAIYSDPARRGQLEKAFDEIGKRPNLGKSCVRFTSLQDIPLEAIGNMLSQIPVDEFLTMYRRAKTL